mmetsp:Transcript_2898/g.5333  ORF Transcript_2898/g.5333 Transcript_2898/m.5333 type:complete len:87 (+) Transcript_2898:34-294(+)
MNLKDHYWIAIQHTGTNNIMESADILVLTESSTRCKSENCKENITRAPKSVYRHKVQRCMDDGSARRDALLFAANRLSHVPGDDIF